MVSHAGDLALNEGQLAFNAWDFESSTALNTLRARSVTHLLGCPLCSRSIPILRAKLGRALADLRQRVGDYRRIDRQTVGFSGEAQGLN